MKQIKQPKPSAFNEMGFNKSIEALKEEIKNLYLEDEIPWVVGYSGGKDSTAVLQLVWLSLKELEAEKRHKHVYVISTDTLVENPIVSAWVANSLNKMADKAGEEGLPISSHKLTPDIKDTFWVNLIGKGYPAPRPKFRWCTERMKIDPSTKFIKSVVQDHGEAIIVLGTRKAESIARARAMARHEEKRVRHKLSPNTTLQNSQIYSVIEDWTNDDVWMFLMQVQNPWGYNNKDLLTMYQGASEDGECPLVVDKTTPSCGDSRFGCWVCTLVDKDKSMQAMIQNDEEKEWMLPLLKLRNELDVSDDRHLRDFRRMNGTVNLYYDDVIPGPYTQKSRKHWLHKLLSAQKYIRENGPSEVNDIELITPGELEEIRRIWVMDKHEIEDCLPDIYEDVFGTFYPGATIDDNNIITKQDVELLKDVSGGDNLMFEMVRELLSLEKTYSSALRRSGIMQEIEKTIRKNYYEDKKDAMEFALLKKEANQEAESRANEIMDDPLATVSN